MKTVLMEEDGTIIGTHLNYFIPLSKGDSYLSSDEKHYNIIETQFESNVNTLYYIVKHSK